MLSAFCFTSYTKHCLTYMVWLSFFLNSNIFIQSVALPSMSTTGARFCNEIYNIDDESRNLHGLQCVRSERRCIICFESNRVVLSNGIHYEANFYLHFYSHNHKRDKLNIPASVSSINDSSSPRTIFTCIFPSNLIMTSQVSQVEINIINKETMLMLLKRKYTILFHVTRIGCATAKVKNGDNEENDISIRDKNKCYLHLGCGTTVIQNSKPGESWFNFDSLLAKASDWGSPNIQKDYENLIRWDISDALEFLPSNSIDLIYMNTLLAPVANAIGGARRIDNRIFHDICKLHKFILHIFIHTHLNTNAYRLLDTVF